jgi:hypothetical protein
VAIALHVNLPALLERLRPGRGSDGGLLAATGYGNGHSNGHANGNGNGNGSNGQSNGNGNGSSHGNGHSDGTYPATDGDSDFLRLMLRYSGLLTSDQRAVVLARVRQLATAHS